MTTRSSTNTQRSLAPLVLILLILVPGLGVAALAYSATTTAYGPAGKPAFWRREETWLSPLLALMGAGIIAVAAWQLYSAVTIPLNWAAIPWWWHLISALAGLLWIPAMFYAGRARLRGTLNNDRLDNPAVAARMMSARSNANWQELGGQAGVVINTNSADLAAKAGASTLRSPLMVTVDGTLRYGIGLEAARPHHMRKRFDSDWAEPQAGHMLIPRRAAQRRFVMIAESGTGKTVFFSAFLQAIVTLQSSGVFIDGKASQKGAEDIKAAVEAVGGSAEIYTSGWDLFRGSVNQVVNRLHVLADSDNEFWDAALTGAMFALVSGHDQPARSFAELNTRIANATLYLPPHLQSLTVTDRSVGLSKLEQAAISLQTQYTAIEHYTASPGWSFHDLHPGQVFIIPLPGTSSSAKSFARQLVLQLAEVIEDRLSDSDNNTPLDALLDEIAQLLPDDLDMLTTLVSAQEIGREANVNVSFSAQSAASFSRDSGMQERLLSSGAALLIGRSKSPQTVINMAGTRKQLESSSDPLLGGLSSGRVQDAYRINPDEIREAPGGAFWLINKGAVHKFLSLMPRKENS